MKKILVVEDDLVIARMIHNMVFVNPNDYTVRIAKSGKDALEQVRNFQPDLIIMDILLGDMNGKDVALTLRQDERFSHIPIIAVSGSLDVENEWFIEGGEERMGVNDFLAKPFTLKELKEKITPFLLTEE